MKLLFKQRAFAWFDSYDIYDENENTVYIVKGQGALPENIRCQRGERAGHCEGADFFLVAPIRTLRGERLHRHSEKRTVGLVQAAV